MAIPVIMLGHQEPPLGEGVMSDSHYSHRSHQHPCSQDHNHLYYDSLHLLHLIKPPISELTTHTLLVWSTIHIPEPSLTPLILTCVFPYLSRSSSLLHYCSPPLLPFHVIPTGNTKDYYCKLSHLDQL